MTPVKSRFWKRLRADLAVALVAVSLLNTSTAFSQQLIAPHPGAESYIPTRIDWLTTTLQASLRSDNLAEDKFMLQITCPDPETILIYVRYLPGVNRAIMNMAVNTAREVIRITAKSYGWDSWIIVREDIGRASS